VTAVLATVAINMIELSLYPSGAPMLMNPKHIIAVRENPADDQEQPNRIIYVNHMIDRSYTIFYVFDTYEDIKRMLNGKT
jgi:hypothetical protein